MQLALPKLRSSNSLKSFSQQLAACNHDLDLWRDRCAAEQRPGCRSNQVRGGCVHGFSDADVSDQRSRTTPQRPGEQALSGGT